MKQCRTALKPDTASKAREHSVRQGNVQHLNQTLFSSLWVPRTGSASDWCALQKALYKCIDTIQYRTMSIIHILRSLCPTRRESPNTTHKTDHTHLSTKEQIHEPFYQECCIKIFTRR